MFLLPQVPKCLVRLCSFHFPFLLSKVSIEILSTDKTFSTFQKLKLYTNEYNCIWIATNYWKHTEIKILTLTFKMHFIYASTDTHGWKWKNHSSKTEMFQNYIYHKIIPFATFYALQQKIYNDNQYGIYST